MMKRMVRLVGFVILSLIMKPVGAADFQQELQDSTSVPRDWYLRDPETDKLQGVSSEKNLQYATERKAIEDCLSRGY